MTHDGAMSGSAAGSPRLHVSDAQHAWLAEIGVEPRLLAYYRPAPVAPPVRAGQAAGVADQRGQETRHETTRNRRDVPFTDPAAQPTAGHNGPALAIEALKKAGLPIRGTSAASAPGHVPAISPRTDASVTSQSGRQPGVTDPHAPQHAGAPAVSPSFKPGSLPADLDALAQHAVACQVCELHRHRDRLVFGGGDAQQPEWLIVGEAPGKADDRTGLPFQGKAGRLLHAMLVGIGVHPTTLVPGGEPALVPAWSTPATMYFTNLLKCRPLLNRSPAASEIQACLAYLLQQIDIVQPRRILVLGRMAAQALLQTVDDVEALRGKVHTLTTASGQRVPVVVTWHPAALLLRPQSKADVWEDLNLARAIQSDG